MNKTRQLQFWYIPFRISIFQQSARWSICNCSTLPGTVKFNSPLDRELDGVPTPMRMYYKILVTRGKSHNMSCTLNKPSSQKESGHTLFSCRYTGKAVGIVLDYVSARIGHQFYRHCVGFSLGAQACGFLGRHFVETGQPQLERITGLDPAGPLFYTDNVALVSVRPYGNVPDNFNLSHLDRTDAVFVDVYHTDGFLVPDATFGFFKVCQSRYTNIASFLFALLFLNFFVYLLSAKAIRKKQVS